MSGLRASSPGTPVLADRYGQQIALFHGSERLGAAGPLGGASGQQGRGADRTAGLALELELELAEHPGTARCGSPGDADYAAPGYTPLGGRSTVPRNPLG